MPTVKATLTVPHREEAERIADLLGLAFESDETPIAFFEDEEAGHWTVDVFRKAMTRQPWQTRSAMRWAVMRSLHRSTAMFSMRLIG
jgi:hypothetical protein